MEQVKLNAEIRTGLGKGESGRIRRQGYVPAVVYRGGALGANIKVEEKALFKAMHTEAGENAIISLNINSGKEGMTKLVMVHETQVDPLNDKLVHVDFHEISLREKIKVNVPVTIKGEAPGVTEEKGVLTQVMWELEVECLPTEIPDHIEINIEKLHMNNAIHIKEVIVPAGIHILGDPDQAVVVVTHQEKEETEEAKVIGEETEEPEVIKKGKKDEEAEGAEEGKE